MMGRNEMQGRMMLVLWLLFAGIPAAFTFAETDAVLITVNGEAVSTHDIDELLGEVHRGLSPEAMKRFDPRTLLDKAVNDCLLSQEALLLEMDQEEPIVAELEKTRRSAAITAYRKAEFLPVLDVTTAEVRAEFDRFYWQILLRQLTVAEEVEAQAIREQILAGADMDALARELSLDTRKDRGGMHDLRLWRDVELELRPAAVDLQPGEVSEPFPYRDAWSIVRCEERSGVLEELFEARAPGIRQYLENEQTKLQWEAFVDSLAGAYPVEVNEEIVALIRADAGLVLDGRFLQDGDAVAMRCGPDLTASEGELRKAVSHQQMQDGTVPFEEALELGLEGEAHRLVLTRASMEAGFYDSPEIVDLTEDKLRQLLIEHYLSETIASKITFRRDELSEFYLEHVDQWPGSDEVLLDLVVVPDMADAEEMERRLAAGTEFDFVRQQMGFKPAGQSNWAPLEGFSEEVQQELEDMEIGDSSGIVPLGKGAMFFQLEGRRPGKPRPFEEVEIQVRGMVFQKKFNALLDEHLQLLKERSEVVYDDEAIREYFGVTKE